MFNNGDDMFHHLIRTHLILPYVQGDFYKAHLSGKFFDFYEGHLSEANSGGKFFALEKPNDSVRPL